MDSAHHTRLHHSHSVLRHIAKLLFPSGLIPSIVLPHYRSVVISVIVPTRLILSLALRGLMILGSLPYYSRHIYRLFDCVFYDFPSPKDELEGSLDWEMITRNSKWPFKQMINVKR